MEHSLHIGTERKREEEQSTRRKQHIYKNTTYKHGRTTTEDAQETNYLGGERDGF